MSKEARQTLCDSVKRVRETDRTTHSRILIAGYLNDGEVKAANLELESYVRDSLQPFQPRVSGLLFNKGLFYLLLLEAADTHTINDYLQKWMGGSLFGRVHARTSVVMQSYENTDSVLRGWECQTVATPGPILTDSDKTDEQMEDRSLELWEGLEEGARKKRDNPNHRISNMFLLSNDDMALLLSPYFMTLEEYAQLYLGRGLYTKEAEKCHPMAPTFFTVMDFLEYSDYETFKAK